VALEGGLQESHADVRIHARYRSVDAG
jgi:hypothetical protein